MTFYGALFEAADTATPPPLVVSVDPVTFQFSVHPKGKEPASVERMVTLYARDLAEIRSAANDPERLETFADQLLLRIKRGGG